MKKKEELKKSESLENTETSEMESNENTPEVAVPAPPKMCPKFFKESVKEKPQREFDLKTDDGIAAFLYDYIKRKNVAYYFVHHYGGFPGGITENFFNEGDVMGTLDYAIVNTLKFFNKDLTRERKYSTVMGAFIKIANREMIDVFKKQYCTENRTIKEESKDGKEGKAIVPAIASFEFDRMAVGEDDDAANNYNSQLIKEKFRQAKASLDVFDQKVLDLKLEGYSIDEMADKLDSCKREIRTSMERIKRKLKADRELEKLCA